MKSKEELLEEKRNFFLIKVEKDKQLDYEEVFGNKNPVHAEIGSGKGEFLAAKALLNPEINFIGFELKMKRIVKILKKLNIEDHPNVRIANFYIDHNITEHIKPQSLDCIYIQHPDPWPKRRHHKHRLIQQPFIDALAKMLKENAEVRIATDHDDYTKWIVKHFKERKDFSPKFENGFTLEPYEGHIVTYFETIKRREGFEPKFMHYRKISY
ncbi:MAG: tRNA (guanosine(46)-N7)-methyltransferase TrmB [Candidatus Cloacimonadota bacterium]|nr:MAG: tRNA (guanosine(46)-N7)-methyltransferase TrmB [Candidatus Cloacimonadota bacterium]